MPHPKETSEHKRQRHIREMRKKLEQHTGQSSSLFVSQDLSPEDEEKFLEHVIAFEGADPVVLFDELEKGGMILPPPDSLDDEQLHANRNALIELCLKLKILVGESVTKPGEEVNLQGAVR